MKLKLNKETLRTLTEVQSENVGGAAPNSVGCNGTATCSKWVTCTRFSAAFPTGCCAVDTTTRNNDPR